MSSAKTLNLLKMVFNLCSGLSTLLQLRFAEDGFQHMLRPFNLDAATAAVEAAAESATASAEAAATAETAATEAVAAEASGDAVAAATVAAEASEFTVAAAEFSLSTELWTFSSFFSKDSIVCPCEFSRMISSFRSALSFTMMSSDMELIICMFFISESSFATFSATSCVPSLLHATSF